MYHSFQAFKDAVLACRPPYAYPAELVEASRVAHAWSVYEHAQQTALDSLVLGRWVEPSDERAPGIDKLVKENFLAMNEVETGGSVMDSRNWTLLVNDAWVLGGVHKHTPFYLASPRTPDNIYDAASGRLTVTGRELVGLHVFGYTYKHGHPALGEVAVCADMRQADGADFATYLRQIAAYSAGDGWRVLVAHQTA